MSPSMIARMAKASTTTTACPSGRSDIVADSKPRAGRRPVKNARSGE
jgi:hypothetical protein